MLIPQKDNSKYIQKYQQEGLNVIPCKEREKLPAISWKEYQNQNYRDDIPSTLNIAVICGKISNNLVVVDVDKSDLDLVNEIYPNALKKTRVVKTGSGGYHIYFRVPELPMKPLRLNKPNGDHIDVQVNGTYVVVPPSIHPNGHEYKIISETEEIKTINFQDIVVNLENAGFKVEKKNNFNQIIKGGIGRGNRHNMALSYCARLFIRHGYDVELVKREMYDWNQTNEPPLPNDELEKIILDSSKFSQSKLQEIVKSNNETPNKIDHGKLADEIMDENRFRTLKETEDVLVFEHGVYKPYGKIKIKEECETKVKCYNSLVAEVIGSIQRRTYTSRDDFDGETHLFNLQNGILDIKTGELIDHDSKYLFRVQLPIEYNPNAVPVKIMKFFRDILPPDYVVWLIDMIAYCLVRDCKQEKAMMLVGDGGNGKSTFLKLLVKFLGDDNTTNHSINELIYDRFAKADLDGKLANIHSDIESDEIDKTGILKMLISGDRIMVQQKNRDSYPMQSFAKLMFSTNQMPDVDEEKKAFYQRWIIIDFVKTFRGTEAENKKLLEELTTGEELSGLLNVVLKRIPRFLSGQGVFNNAPSGEELKQTWREHANSIESFISNEIVLEEGVKIIKKDLFGIYLIFCKKRKFKPFSERTFSQSFKMKIGINVKDYPVKIKGKSERCWVGINLKNPPEPIEKQKSDQETLDFK